MVAVLTVIVILEGDRNPVPCTEKQTACHTTNARTLAWEKRDRARLLVPGSSQHSQKRGS
jgi:hypothetical protein